MVSTAQKRLLECVRTLFFAEDLTSHLGFGLQGSRALLFERYRLALTKDLLERVLVDPDRLFTAFAALDEQLNGHPISGYYKGDVLFPNDPVTPAALDEQYWIASGRAGFSADAPQHFFLPERYTDPFGNVSTISYDTKYDLFVESITDARGNNTRVVRFDFRVFAPSEIADINENRSEVYFDVLGMVVASAVKGKKVNDQWEGDNLDGFTLALSQPPVSDTVSFCTSATFNETQARTWLANAGSRFVYHFGERIDAGRRIWNDRMPGACAIVRERHVSQVALDPLQPIHCKWRSSVQTARATCAEKDSD